MAPQKNDILQGTLALLVLRTLASNRRIHGYAITTHIQRVSADLLRAQFSADPRVYKNARVLVGTDTLGHFVAAIDSNHDGRVEEYLMFADENRLEGPWSSILERANVLLTSGSIRIEAEDLSFGASVVVEGGPEPALAQKEDAYKKTIVRASGVALLGAKPGESDEALLTTLDVTNIHTWPDSFAKDFCTTTDQ